MLTNDQDWRIRAACRGMSTEAFYPPDDAPLGEAAAISRATLKVCADCPVRSLCLQDADDYGVWGGTSQTERRRARKAPRGPSLTELRQFHLPGRVS